MTPEATHRGNGESQNVSGIMTTFKMNLNKYRFNIHLSVKLVEEIMNIARWTK